MDTASSKNREFRKTLANILGILVILAMALPLDRSALAQGELPYLRAFPDGDGVDGYRWPLGATVHLAIDNPATEGAPDHEQDTTAVVSPWDETSTYIEFNFGGVYDLKAGDLVTASSGDVTRVFVIPPLEITTVDVDADVVAGTADPGTQIHVFSEAQLFVDADTEGAWLANFAGLQDLQPSTGGGAEIFLDEFGDSTIYYWSAPPPPIVGEHGHDTGDVPSWACNAGGWAMDPDAPLEDVTVRILLDGSVMLETVASDYREDLETAWNEGSGGCPGGTCSFHVSLWEYISHYETHEITVQAQDVPTGDWYALGNTPKTLTCRTYDIYAYNPSTGTTQLITKQLTDTDEWDSSWSPDGKKVAHDVAFGDGTQTIYITNVQTGVSTLLKGAQNGNDAAWSPGGKHIVFDRDESLYRLPPAGGTPRLLRHDAASATWSPNGKFLAFYQPSDGSIRTIFYSTPGGAAKFLSYGETPSWSPDGKWIAYHRDGDIWKVRVDGLGVALGGPIQVTSGPFIDGEPTWSSDSAKIIYQRGMTRDFDLWSVSAAGGTPTWLTGGIEFGDYTPANARNSPKVAYASFTPKGQAARDWSAAFTSDPQTWSEGEHSYHIEWAYTFPEPGGSGASDEIQFTVSNGAPPYDGFVLLRGFGLRAQIDGLCTAIDPAIRPEQGTRFVVGFPTDNPITYQDAVAYFNSFTVTGHWDGGGVVDLTHQEILPASAVDFQQYVCDAFAQ